MVADVPVGVLLSGGIDSSIVVALLAEMGQKDLKTYSIGFEAEGGEAGDEFDYSDLVAKTYGTDHTKFTRAQGRHRRGPAGRGRGDVRADDEPRRHRLLPPLAGGLEVDQGGAVGPGRRRGARRLRLVPADRRRGPRGRRRRLPPLVLRPPARRARRPASPPSSCSPTTRRSTSSASTSPAAAPTSAVDAALRLDTTVMLVDDPVKRVDNMTMAWGLEARVPFLDHDFVETMGACPPALQDGRRRQGRAQGRVARGAARRDHRPEEGLLPGPGDPPALRPGARAGHARRSPTRPRRSAGSSGPTAWPRCSTTPTRAGPTSAPTHCGRSHSWRCGCRPTASADVGSSAPVVSALRPC